MKKIQFTNIVYGEEYCRIFMDYGIKSLLDPSNLPAFKDRCEYAIYTDEGSLKFLRDENHPNMKKLFETVPIEFFTMTPQNHKTPNFDNRYELLRQVFKMSVNLAITKNALAAPWVADLVVAKGFIAKVLRRIDAGHDAVFVLPLRAAKEGIAERLQKDEWALSAMALFEAGYQNLHPLWTHSHWNNPQFTKMPFTMLWNSGSGLLARSFSVTPVVFEPHEQMIVSGGMIDVDIPGMFKNPYWATDWVDAPIIGVEPLRCYYPPFVNEKASAKRVRAWSRNCLKKEQLAFPGKCLFYPSAEVASFSNPEMYESDTVISDILLGG